MKVDGQPVIEIESYILSISKSYDGIEANFGLNLSSCIALSSSWGTANFLARHFSSEDVAREFYRIADHYALQPQPSKREWTPDLQVYIHKQASLKMADELARHRRTTRVYQSVTIIALVSWGSFMLAVLS